MAYLRELAKKLVFRHTRFGAPTYPYTSDPIELALLVMEMERQRGTPGIVLEVGVARGMTTRLLAEHSRRSTGDRIVALDTFSSFTKRDLDYEMKERGKTASELAGFGYNDFAAWKRNFQAFSSIVTPIKADCAEFDYSTLGPIKLAYLDVDLYLPTKAALPKIYDCLVPGSAIFVDDVSASNGGYDGAYHAYMEFCAERGIQTKLHGYKCGEIRKSIQGQ
ncbi:MAG TPA: TylF/MycF/NovP-related O-methyltransferase [Rhizomicrobium sp.]|nr:TylF/MycF/NovP-related O-methyltransferase [Rhizomicrobium sp.]